MSEDISFEVKNFVAGEYADASDGSRFIKLAPASGKPLASIPASTAHDVDRAVRAARAAFDSGPWHDTPAAERGRLIYRLADLLERDADEFSEILAHEQGRPVYEMRMMDLPLAIDTLRYFAGWADKLEGRCIPTRGAMGKPTLNYTIRQPIGVVAQLVPWNAPLMIAIWKLAPALATGCTVVVKPAEDAPIAISTFARLLREAGFPPGVVNVINGQGAAAGSALVSHSGVDMISFTGSSPVGRTIARDAAIRFARTSLELGGKAPQIVFPDADIDAAVQGLLMGLYVNQGQTCAAGSRILVHRSIAKQVTEALAAAADGMRIGDPLDPQIQMGALINQRHLNRVRDYIGVGVQEGAKLVAGNGAVPDEGFFMRPTLFADAANHMRIAQEEIFGPVGVIIPFDDDREAIAAANDVAYGLSASVWTRDLSRAHILAPRLRVGAVAINTWSPLDARLPWGGIKESGAGHDLSKTALDSYMNEQVVTVAL